MEYMIKPYSHRAWLLEFKTSGTNKDGFSKTLCLNILRLAERFKTQSPSWEEVVPGYNSLLLKTRHDMRTEQMSAQVKAAIDGFKPLKTTKPAKDPLEIAVNYGGEAGPDLERVAKACGLTPEEVIARHCGRDYLVCMMGFIPGFAYLSETDPTIHVPRRTDPRLHVPGGSIGLAGWQTGIYGLSSPAGWQIIGQTSLTLFDASAPTPFLLKAGDWVRFVPQNSKSKPKKTRQKKVYNV